MARCQSSHAPEARAVSWTSYFVDQDTGLSERAAGPDSIRGVRLMLNHVIHHGATETQLNRRGWRVALIVALSVIGEACLPGNSDRLDSGSVGKSQQASTQRANFVVDSLSQLVNTDSLFRLRRAMLTSIDTAGLFNAMLCESYALQWQHGGIPADRAIKRMQDTVWQDMSSARRRELQRYPGRPISGAVTTACERGAKAPTHVDGVSLDIHP